jgi:Uma2 family endonuclease
MATRGFNPAIKLTYEHYRLLPEGERHELLDGDLVLTPAPGSLHQIALLRLLPALQRAAASSRPGLVGVAPWDVILDGATVVQPDLFFVEEGRLEIIAEEGVRGPPDLVVEVLSPSTLDRDRVIKRDLYARFGVNELWIADPEARRFELYENTAEGFKLRLLVEGDQRPVSTVIGEVATTPAEVFAPLPGRRE